MLDYKDFQQNIINFLNVNKAWDRAVSLDIETDLRILDDPKKNILSISVARRVENRICIEKFILDNENEEEEAKIFIQFGYFCQRVRPLVIIGYGISRFDLPILLFKMKQLDKLFNKSGRYEPAYWAFRDAVTMSYFLDMINPVRFEIAKFDNTTPKFIPLESAISHKRFEHLPFMKTKAIVSKHVSNVQNKWDVIYRLWKEDRNSFNKYIEGDVHDTLLIAEELMLKRLC